MVRSVLFNLIPVSDHYSDPETDATDASYDTKPEFDFRRGWGGGWGGGQGWPDPPGGGLRLRFGRKWGPPGATTAWCAVFFEI